jgi:hypothetical protein
MKIITGVVLIILGIAAGAYVGIWLCFVGGIIDVIQEIKADDLSAMGVAIGVAKIVFSGFAGWLSAVIGVIPGYAILSTD